MEYAGDVDQSILAFVATGALCDGEDGNEGECSLCSPNLRAAVARSHTYFVQALSKQPAAGWSLLSLITPTKSRIPRSRSRKEMVKIWKLLFCI
jgi:hypothetical protein